MKVEIKNDLIKRLNKVIETDKILNILGFETIEGFVNHALEEELESWEADLQWV